MRRSASSRGVVGLTLLPSLDAIRGIMIWPTGSTSTDGCRSPRLKMSSRLRRLRLTERGGNSCGARSDGLSFRDRDELQVLGGLEKGERIGHMVRLFLVDVRRVRVLPS